MNTNFVPSLLIGNGTDTATDALSAAGDIIMVKAEDHSEILTAAEAAALGDNVAIQFLQKTGVDGVAGVRQSVKLTRKGIEHFSNQVAANATQTQYSIAFADFDVDTRVKVVITMTPDLDLQPGRVIRHEFVTDRLKTGGVNAAIDRLVSQINNHGNLKGLILASHDADGPLLITGQAQLTKNIDDYAFVDFDVFAAYFVADGTSNSEAITESGGTTVTASLVSRSTAGSGLPIQIRTLERIARGYEGHTNLRHFDNLPPATEVDSTKVYDMLVLEGRYAVEGDFQFLAPYPAKVQIALPKANDAAGDGAQATALKAIISGWLNKQTTSVIAGE